MTRLRSLWDRLRGSYWAVPSAMAIAAAVFAVVMTHVDEALPSRPAGALSWVYTGGPDGARAVLSTIAASMMTVAGVTFSITIVALTLASQQFGPRLLRNFLRDLGNQITLGTFIATYLYCLLVLRTVRGADGTEFVPHLAVSVGVALATASLGVLIYFIHHVSTSIQASHVVANVAADLEAAIARLFPVRRDQAPSPDTHARQGPNAGSRFAHARPVRAVNSGYVHAVDGTRLMSLAREHDLLVRIDAPPGTFVRKGSVLLSVVRLAAPAHGVDDALRTAFIVGTDRAGTQDVAFFISQLVELAVRALSPGINDPATARMCIDRLEAALSQMAGRAGPAAERHDDDHVLRVVAVAVTFADMLDAAFTEIARYGRSSVSVSCRLLDALRTLAPCVSSEDQRLALSRHAAGIGGRPAGAFADAGDRAAIAASYAAAVAALHRPPRPADH